MSLASLQKQMLELVYSSREPRKSCPARMAFYRDLTRASLQETFEAVYSLTERVFKEKSQMAQWWRLVDRYTSAHWPTDFRLSYAVQRFPEFLKGPAWLKELADYEWTRFQANSSREPRSSDLLNPSLQLRIYSYPVAEWYREAGEKGRKRLPAAPKAFGKGKFCTLGIYHHPEKFQVRTLELNPAVFELLMQWQSGGSPEKSAPTLAQQTGRPVNEIKAQLQPILQMLLQERILFQS